MELTAPSGYRCKFHDYLTRVGPLAQLAERGADNAKVVSSTLTRTTELSILRAFFCVKFFFFACEIRVTFLGQCKMCEPARYGEKLQ